MSKTSDPRTSVHVDAVRRIPYGVAVDEAARAYGARIGWTFDDEDVSFERLRDQSDRVARALSELGVGKGDRVAAWMPNIPEFLYCLAGCAKIGAILAPMNTRWKRFEVEHFLAHCEARVVIHVGSFLNNDFSQLLSELIGSEDIDAKGRVAGERFPQLRQLVRIGQQNGWMTWNEFLDAGDALEPSQRPSLQSGDPLLLQYTSGTTALPKGALCSHVYMLNRGTEVWEQLGLFEGEPILNTQPVYHVGGACVLSVPLNAGFRIVTPSHYEPARVLELIARERCVGRTGFGPMYAMEMALPGFAGYDLSSLRCGWYVGTPELMRQVRDRMGIGDLVQIYGSTEGAGAFGLRTQPWEMRERSCGRAYRGVEIAIFDPAGGRLLPPEAAGEIIIRGWGNMIGYFRQPEQTASAIDGEGWLHTGDYGRLDAEGNLYFLGRIKNMIRVGGENMTPEEVEMVLETHPAVSTAIVIGIPHDRLGEAPVAIVELTAGAAADAQELIAYCHTRMANFRVPRAVHFVTEWPLTGSGKVERRTLEARYGGMNAAAPTLGAA